VGTTGVAIHLARGGGVSVTEMFQD